MVLDHDDAPAGCSRGRREAPRVERLDRVEVDDAGGQPALDEPLRGVQAGVQGDAGAGEQHAVVAGAAVRTLEPPMGNASSAAYSTGYAPRVVRR